MNIPRNPKPWLTPGEVALETQMQRAPDLRPGPALPRQAQRAGADLEVAMAAAPDLTADPASAKVRMEEHKANHEWCASRAQTFSDAGLSIEIVEGGVVARCRANDHAKFIRRGTELTPEMLTCSGGCNRSSADPDFGMNRPG
jgi:hypothetical protein